MPAEEAKVFRPVGGVGREEDAVAEGAPSPGAEDCFQVPLRSGLCILRPSPGRPL